MSEHDVNIPVKARDEASAVFKKVAENAREEMNAMERLNEIAGRKSEFTHILHALEGAGAAAGLGIASKLLEEMSGKAAELAAELRKGDVSAADMAGDFARSVPILGDFVKTFDNIIDMVTGEKEAAEQLNEQAKLGVEIAEMQIKAAKEHRVAVDELTKALRAEYQEQQKIGLSPAARAAADIHDREQNRTDDQKEALDKLKADTEAKFNEANKKAMEDARAASQTAIPDLVEDQSVSMGTGGQGTVVEGNAKEVAEAKAARQAGFDAMKALAAARDQEVLEAQKAFSDLQVAKTKTDDGLIAKIREESAQKRAEAAKAEEEHIAAMQSEARRAQMKANGDYLGAELDQIDEASSEKINAAAKEYQDRVKDAEKDRKLNGDEETDRQIKMASDTSNAKMAAARAKDDADTREAEKRDAERKEQREGDVAKHIAQIRIDALKAEGAAGNPIAEMEAKRLEIAEKYREQREQINRLIKEDSGLTDDQRKRLALSLNTLAGAENRELANVRPGAGESSQFKAPSLTESRTLTGAGAARREQQEVAFAKQQAAAIKANLDAVKLQEQIRDGMNVVSDWIKNSPTASFVKGLFGESA